MRTILRAVALAVVATAVPAIYIGLPLVIVLRATGAGTPTAVLLAVLVMTAPMLPVARILRATTHVMPVTVAPAVPEEVPAVLKEPVRAAAVIPLQRRAARTAEGLRSAGERRSDAA